MASDFDIHIGTREIWGGRKIPFGLTDTDLFQHLWMNGQTGVGKSALMRSMIAQTIHNGHGCTLIDFHGDQSLEVLEDIPLRRRDDVVICDLADTEHILPINPFFDIPRDKRSTFAEEFTEACKNIWYDSWGERMDWILSNTVAAILHAPKAQRPTLLSIGFFLTDQAYREDILRHVTDPKVIQFFRKEFDRYSPKERDLFIIPVENKIGKILSNPYVVNALAPHVPSFQFQHAISNRSIVIVRLPKGVIGARPAKLLGSLAVSSIINSAMEQAVIPYQDRIPHFLFIDEQHNLNSTALTSAYSELRKYKLGIISSTQYTEQMPENVLKSMFGNIGTIIAFRSSAADAQRFEHQIGHFPAAHYTQLGLGQVRVRLLQGGSPVDPFRAKTEIDLIDPSYNTEQIREYNHERYTTPRSEVEKDYGRWMRKMLVDPERRQEQKQQIAETQRQRTVRVPVPPVIETADSTISKRRDTALRDIREIVDNIRKKNPETEQYRYIYKKPTRRQHRRHRV